MEGFGSRIFAKVLKGYQGTGEPLNGADAHVQGLYQLGKGISGAGFRNEFQDTKGLTHGMDDRIV